MIATNRGYSAETINPIPFLQHLSEEDRRFEKLAEAIDLASQVVDPLEAYRDGTETWLPMGTGMTGATHGRTVGMLTSGFDTELELAMARDEMRYLAANNPYAINAHENRVSYIVGDGHTYDVAAKGVKGVKGGKQTVSDDDVAAAQEVVDAFVAENDWNSRQSETVVRLDRDGEVFIRYFPGNDGVLRIRFVEPGLIATPNNKANDPNVRFGIEFDPDDAETPIAYYINGEYVEAQYIQHRKSNVDRTTPRGVPLMFGQRMNLRRASKNVLNISAKIDVLSAISLIRKHTGTRAGVLGTVQAAAQYQKTDSRNGQTTYNRSIKPGSIFDTSDTVTYEAPPVDGIEQLVMGVALNLRSIASRLVMPEFMVSSDASNANYASTMVAEGPSVKSFERLQKRQSCWDLELLWRALEVAGLGVVRELKRKFEIRVGMPTIISRDDLKKAEENKILHEAGVMSPQEWSSQAGLDYEKNQTEIEEHKASGRVYTPGMAPASPFGGLAGGGEHADIANKRAALKGQLDASTSIEESLAIIRGIFAE